VPRTSGGLCADYRPSRASGAAFGGAWGEIYRRLIETGMPKTVTGWTEENAFLPESSGPWSRYWGTLSPIAVPFWACEHRGEVKFAKTVRDGFEVIEYETGALTRQILNNDDAYSMPSFERFHVRDRKSWEQYKKLAESSPPWPKERLARACAPYLRRERPLFIDLGSTWGGIRELMGPERACTVLYDDPELAQEIIDWQRAMRNTYQYPLVEYLRPEIVALHEDCCYNHGMLIGPRHFLDFCGASYREIAQWRNALELEMFAVDSDGDVSDLIPRLVELGANALYPLEAKANRNLPALGNSPPNFILMAGWKRKSSIKATSA